MRGLLGNVFAVVAGLVVGSLWNMGIVQLNLRVLHPMPSGLDMNDAEQFDAFMATLPTSAFVVVLVAHLGQAFFGGWVAARLSRSHPVRMALVIGVLSLVGGVAAMFMIEGPAWLMIELPLYLVLAWVAGRMVESKRNEPT